MSKAILLSYKRLGLWHRTNKIPIHHYEGIQAADDLYYGDRPYLRDGIKVARRYVDGVGTYERHAIFYLR